MAYMNRWVETIVLAWLVLELTNSPLQVALVGFYRMVPMFLLSPLAGAIADRLNRHRVIIIAQAASLLVSTVMAFLMLSSLIEVWHIALGMLIVGTAWSFDFPSRRSFIMDIVGPVRITNAMGLDTTAMTGSKMLGPLLGGVLIAVAGEGWAFVLIAFLYLLGLLFLMSVKAEVRSSPGNREPILRNIVDGISYALGNRVMLRVLAVTVAMNLLLFPYVQLVPVIARDVLNVGPSLMGLLMAADGLGAFVGAITIASLSLTLMSRRRIFLGGSLSAMVFVLLFSGSGLYPLSLILLIMAGVSFVGFGTMQSIIVLTSVSPEMRGRAVGTVGLAIGVSPLGLVLMGTIANTLGTPMAVAISTSIGIVALVAIALLSPGFWRSTSQTQESKSQEIA